MSEPNAHALILEGWAQLLQALQERRIEALQAAQQLHRIANGADKQTLEAIRGVIQQTEQFLERLKWFRDFLETVTHSPAGGEDPLLRKPLVELGLSNRVMNTLECASIVTVSDLIQRTADDLLEERNFGMTSLCEVRDKLQALGLKLKGD